MENSPDHPISDFANPKNQAMGYALFVWPLIGILLGWYLAPERSSNNLLAVFVIVGAFGAAAVLIFGVLFANRVLKISVAAPIGLSALGAKLGLAMGLALAAGSSFRDGRLLFLPMFILGAGGAIAGICIQVAQAKQSKSKLAEECEHSTSTETV